jgi:HAD superfamily hydrolase (TIGR01458 family)
MATIRGVIFDIDGVLKYQGRVYPGAVELVATLRERGLALRFLTNSTLNSRESCAQGLRRYGFRVELDEVITASYATAVYLRGLNPHSIWLLVDREGQDEFKDFTLDEHNPEYVVIGDARSRFDFDHLNHALRLLANGAELIGMQAEILDHSMGELELNVGAWVGMLEQASGTRAVYIGKPNPFAFELALGSMDLSRREVLVVGDRVSTDILGASQAGLQSALVRTGEFDPRHLDGSPQPDYTLDSISDLVALWQET